MTITDISEALHQVGAATQAPAIDRVAFERELRSQRRRRTTGRVAVAGLAAAAVAAVGFLAVPQVREGVQGAVDPAAPGPSPSVALDGQLDKPAVFVADGRLVAVDPTGVTHELDGRVEELLGATNEDIWAIDGNSRLVRWHASTSGEGPGGWRFERSDDLPHDGPVQSAALSADGRWVGWVDLDEKVTVVDLEAGDQRTWGTDELTGTRYLTDVAQGTGFPLVAEEHGLTLGATDRDIRFDPPADGDGWLSTATSARVAVAGWTDSVVYEIGPGEKTELRSFEGTATLSPDGKYLTVLDLNAEPPVFSIWSPAEGLENVDVLGTPQAAGWADDDTALVATLANGSTRVYACEVSDGTCVDLTPPQSSFGQVTFDG